MDEIFTFYTLIKKTIPIDIENIDFFLTIYTMKAVTCKILYHDLSLEICVPTSYEWEEERIIRLAVKIQT